MFIIFLLLASPVTGEWVEIAQYHHRKEPFRRVTDYEQSSKANRIYINHTITERPWNNGVVTRIPNVGNVKRVILPSKTMDAFTIGNINDNTDKTTFDSEYEDFSSVRGPNLKNEKSSESINVKRNNRNNNDGNTRKTFSINNNKANSRSPSQYTIRRVQVTPNNTPNIFKQNRKEAIEKNKSEISKLSNSQIYETFNVDHDFTVEKKSNIKRLQNVAAYDKHENNEFNVGSTQYSNKNYNTRNNSNNMKIEEHMKISASNEMHDIKNILSKSPPTISSELNNDGNENRDTSNPNKSSAVDNNVDELKRFNAHPLLTEQIKIENARNVKNNNFHIDQETIIEGNKMGNNSKNNIEVLFKLMKLITDNIASNTRRSFKGKMKYLEVLRNNILMNIEERIDQAWPDDGQRRRRRAARGHVEFPSSESALMTISFLTFAVFLIKLVLQVIHTYKNKTMMVTPAVVAAVGRAAATLREPTSN